MPTVSPSAWGPKPQWLLPSGLPAVGYKLFAYLAGSVGTKTDTYTNSTGVFANTNPLILDTNGQPTGEWWWVSGQAYKIIFAPAADTDPPTSPIWTVDNVRGIGDATITPSEWVASSLVPTFLSATSFSLTGDQTSTFQVGRRLKTTNTAGFIYSSIVSSVFGSVTTVTVLNDSGVLDSGLVAVSYGIISTVNTSDPYSAPIGSGDVVGPASSTNGHFATYSGATGKLLQDTLALDTDGTLAANSNTRVPSQQAVKTYAQPLDADLTALAGLAATTDNFMQAKSSAWASRTVAQVSADLQGTGLLTGAVGFRTIPQNSQSAAYTTVAADAGKHLLHPSADTTARTFTIDSNANVAYPVGTAITFVNQASAGVMTISITSDTMRLAGAGTTGSRTLAANGIATALKVTTTEWIVSGTGLT